MLDIVVKGGTVIDGTGAPWFKADVGIVGDSVACIAKNIEGDAITVINAAGKIVSPGFIDIHTHSDTVIIRFPERLPKVSQGVTTEVFSNCGLGVAPVTERGRKELLEYNREEYKHITFDWLSVKEFLARIPASGVNVAYLVPHGALRVSVMGYQARPATLPEIKDMCRLLEEGMADGAYGLSTGLAYVPMSSADTQEVIELSKIASKYGGFLASHMRNYREKVRESVQEMIEVAQKADLPVQISHYQAYGEYNWGRGQELIEWLESAREQGFDLTFDSYPYDFSAGFLRNTIPGKYHAGGSQGLIACLKDPQVRQALRREIGTLTTYDLNKLVVASVSNSALQDLVGKSLPQIAAMRKQEIIDVLCELLIHDLDIRHANFQGSAEDTKILATSRLQMVGSDSIDVLPGQGKPHPRLYGTFTRFLKLYVRDDPVLTWEEAIRKMTGLPAWRIGFKRRGLLKEGFAADVVVIDPEKVADRATIERPEDLSTGIDWVIVNGKVEIADGIFTGVLGGRVLKKGVD
ncbi:MAG TPA: D-aminoacylase [Firmicutes bacterium]|nr:D-aminoacylase [Candidatus Fermentithermobacillaceae bacterium]